MPKRFWTAEKVLEDILDLKKSGVDLRHGSVQEDHKRLVSAAIRYFGSWRSAVEASGLNYEKLRRTSEEKRLEKIGKWSEERIITGIKQLSESEEDLRAVIVKNKYPSLFSAAVSPRYFGNWRKALEAAGVDYDKVLEGSPRGRPKRTDVWHTNLIIEKIREMHSSGAVLGHEEISEKFPRLHKLATKRFGSWHAAVDVALQQQV